MSLPININELINGKSVEWERIEFREGWNPERILKTICAFANDFNNWGSGYIILGISEKNGAPIFPPVGIPVNKIDSIQKQLNEICRRIIPNYFPIVEPLTFKKKKILIIWCPGGNTRPYKAPGSLGKSPKYSYFIRRYSSTVKANINEERELIGMSNQIPFDDQVNHKSKITDLDILKIREFLNEIKSNLRDEIENLNIKELSRIMNIAEGSNELFSPKNVGILLFGKKPNIIFPYARIEVVTFKDDSGTEYNENIFEGAIHRQLQNALDYFKGVVITEKVIKDPKNEKSLRIYNYPYAAVEEAIANAVYHRGYDNNNPIEVRIYPSKIVIISFPGPLPPLNRAKLKKLELDVRKYRNRRIGEFLKELHLTEGRMTGIKTIINALKENGSPPLDLDTDKDRTYFKVTIHIHRYFLDSDKKKAKKSGTKSALSWHQVCTKLNISREELETILKLCIKDTPIIKIMQIFNRT
ncbi:MAG: putative DNA binding domain-containing protein, partial [bacterium]|nr:putative DNA binding domain-containing protein [bacterium]